MIEKFKIIKMNDFENCNEIIQQLLKNTVRSKNVLEELKITKEQSKKGMITSMKIHTADVCRYCNDQINEKCKNCYGIGYTFTEKEIKVKIPPKTKNNDCIVYRKIGNQFSFDDERGNVYIRIKIYGDKRKRKGRMFYV